MLLKARGKASDNAYKGLALTLSDVAVHLEEWIAVVILFIKDWSLTHWVLSTNFIVLIDYEIICLENKAVAWDVGSGLEKHDISDNEVPDTDTLSGTELASDDSNCFLFDQRLKSNESFILEPISHRGDSNQDNSSNDNGNTFN